MCRATSTYILSSTALLRDGMRRMLGSTPFRVLGAGHRLVDLKISPKNGRPILVILFSDGFGPDTEDTIKAIHAAISDARIVLFDQRFSAADMMTGLRLGVSAYLANTISADALLKSLEVVMVGGIVLPALNVRELSELSPTPPPPLQLSQSIDCIVPTVGAVTRAPPEGARDMPALSDRESLILRSLIRGDSNKHIARDLSIAEATVKVHVKAILRKIRVRNRTQAAIWAISNGETAPSSVPSLTTPLSVPPPAPLYLAPLSLVALSETM